MSLPLISVVIPTIAGREELLAMCKDDYLALSGTNANVQLIVVEDAPSCGAAWQMGSEQAEGDYIHLTADDIEPLEGWDRAAIDAWHMGVAPASRVWRPDGSLESGVRWETDGDDWAEAGLVQVPFCSYDAWHDFIGPMVPIQYYSDNWFTHKAVDYGCKVRLTPGYSFIHHRPPVLRAGESEQTLRDRRRYERYLTTGYTWADAGRGR